MKKTKAIELIGISKQYAIHHEKPTLVEKFIKGKDEIFLALKNINLTIYKGQKVGIIGPNGSGKTTLLKIITGISKPTTGVRKIHGRIVSLIDLDAGFHPDLTGEQNIYLCGMLLGMSKSEVKHKIQSIIKYADIKQFIDAPLFTYSQGMVFRLAFAVGIHADPDILLLDENIGVGDADFQKKSQKTIQNFFNRNKTIIIVSHWQDFIQKNCNRIIEIDRGGVVSDSFPDAE